MSAFVKAFWQRIWVEVVDKPIRLVYEPGR